MLLVRFYALSIALLTNPRIPTSSFRKTAFRGKLNPPISAEIYHRLSVARLPFLFFETRLDYKISMHQTLSFYRTMINDIRNATRFDFCSSLEDRAWKTSNSSGFFQKDQRIIRVIRDTHPFLPPSPVSPEQILAFHLHPCPAGRLRHRLNTNRNAAVYQSRIDTAPSLESSGRCDEIRPPDRKSFLSLDAFVYFPHLELLGGTTIFFPLQYL